MVSLAMSTLVTAVLYAGIVVLVPLLVVLPLLLLERRRKDGGASLSEPSAGAGFPGTTDDRARRRDADGSTGSESVACRACGALNGAEYTFCRECADSLAGR
jgi:hypothetical protein